jgi:hypothetical protein
MDLSDERMRKACLRTKSLIAKNELFEIGCMVKRGVQSVKLYIYFTPFQLVTDFGYSISKEPNLEIDSYCKEYREISANKQIRIEVNASLRNIPYSMPIMNLQFSKGAERKSTSFYVPLPVHRFLDMQPIQKGELERELSSATATLKRVEEFRVSSSVFRQKDMLEYFPSLAQISSGAASGIQRYAAACSFKRHSFVIIINLIGREKMGLQGVTRGDPLMEYLMMSVRKIVARDQ